MTRPAERASTRAKRLVDVALAAGLTIAAIRATDDEVEILTTNDPRVTKAARNTWDD